MNTSAGNRRIELEQGATVAVIGGGPAGVFFAIHLLRKSRHLGREIKVTIFERRRSVAATAPACLAGNWKGCNYCAGGISPRLNRLLQDLDLRLPPEVVQSRIHAITIQGFWKNIELEAPAGLEILSVYRGSRPVKRSDRRHSLDSFLLEEALKAGATLIAGEVSDVKYAESGKPLVGYRTDGAAGRLEVDLVVFAAGVNEIIGPSGAGSPMLQSLRRLIPDFVPPQLRRALIFELEAKPSIPASLSSTLHFVEYGSKTLPLEMCSLVPKRGFITIVLVGASVDRADHWEENRKIMRQFLDLPHIRKLLPPGTQLTPACVCNPNMVVGTAKNPFGDRVAAVGDLATARLYKDGILSAQDTACALAETVLAGGIDAGSLKRGYEPTLERFRRDNRFARLVFLLHRLFFSSSVLSRVLYQAVITERKTTPGGRRRLEQILWRIASGDDEYERIFLSMIHPATVWLVLAGGMLITLRNHLTELIFGLRWEGFGRFTTGVPLERLEAKRLEFSRLIMDASVAVPERLEFERMYTIKIRATRNRILEQLGCFGEIDRGYLRARWIRIRRTQGAPNAPGCVIQYEVITRHFAFSLELEQVVGGHLAVYRVRDGFAKGGVLIFEIEKLNEEVCALSIYVAFNFARGRTWATRPFWWLFRLLFPAYVHDVLWNHSLCQLKDSVEVNRENGLSGFPTTGSESVRCVANEGKDISSVL
jgi:flavin-dependent dehydrogenase